MFCNIKFLILNIRRTSIPHSEIDRDHNYYRGHIFEDDSKRICWWHSEQYREVEEESGQQCDNYPEWGGF